MAYRVGDRAVADRAGRENWTADAAPSIVPGLSRPSSARHRISSSRPRLPPCPELDCVRALLPASTVAMAELRAAEIGVGAERVLIAEGAITEERYLRALSI